MVYPRFNKDMNPKELNPIRLLTAALKAADYPATLDITPGEVPQARALHELHRKTGLVQFMWTMTSQEREAQALPIRVPIDGGLFGWRLLVARQERLAALAEVTNLEELRRHRLLQGLHWPDTAVLRHNGLSVVVSHTHPLMYGQLRADRADAFPRSVEEVWWELEQYGQGLGVVPGVVLHYPTALYYFVQPGDTELAQAIENGLAQLRASGVFKRLFDEFHGVNLARAKLAQRRVIELTNPTLSPQTPLDRQELWFRP